MTASPSDYRARRSASDNGPVDPLRRRIRAATLFFIAGLFLSGATALPIPTEVAGGVRLLGDDLSARGRLPPAAVTWLRTVRDGIEATDRAAPFMFYGTDWLA